MKLWFSHQIVFLPYPGKLLLFWRDGQGCSIQIVRLLFEIFLWRFYFGRFFLVEGELINMWHERGSHANLIPDIGIEPIASRTPGRHSIHWARRTQGEQSHLTEFICDSRPTYCIDQHCRFHRDLVISEWRLWILSIIMKCEKWIDQHDSSVGQRKNLSIRQRTEIILFPLVWN